MAPRPVALALEAEGVAMLACADVDEGVDLRDAGVRAPILVFGALGISDLDGIFTHRLTPTISSPWAGRALAEAAAARDTVLDCHVKIDTGMNRLGLRHDNLRRTLPAILAAPSLRVGALYTHFATADDPESEHFPLQQQNFIAAREVAADLGLRTTHAHAANSAALLRDERVWFDAVRPGLLLYGIVPPPLMSTLALEPALSLHSRIVAVKGVRDGEAIGYGQAFRADGPRTLAVVPAGYADGLDWRLGNRGVVLVRGRRVPDRRPRLDGHDLGRRHRSRCVARRRGRPARPPGRRADRRPGSGRHHRRHSVGTAVPIGGDAYSANTATAGNCRIAGISQFH